ncbi:RNA exonuclease 1, partial [Eschrichtius robustus]|nr:RNA exonuclease 1 [Eschrichtius robustus]
MNRLYVLEYLNTSGVWLGYDPYNPELPKPPAQRENGALGRGAEPRSDILELELVNQAIEAVRSEVELEQRRYRELLETAREHGSAEAPALAPHGPTAGLDGDAFPLSFEYNPGGRGLLSPDASYQPTPLASPTEPGTKYSLASLDRGQGHGGGAGGTLEYVPKAVGQPRRYGRPVSSGKYVVDNSKPSTDLEYDPLSNFSARLLSRASSKDDRAPKRPRGSRGSEPYTPAPKKPCDPFGGCDARFSDSDDDTAAAPGDRPATASPPRARAGPESKAPGKPGSREGPEPEEGSLRETKEMAVQYDVGDLGQPAKGPGGLPPAKPSSPGRASQERSSPKEGRPKKKKSGGPPAAGRKDGVGKTGRGQGGEHGRPAEKPCVDRRGPQAGSPRHRAERPQGTKKKPSSATPPPKEEKAEEQGRSGLTTLFPGQKRRISHLSKQGKEALNEEKVAYDRSPSKNIYLNVAVNTLKKLRGLGPGTGPGLNKPSGRRVVSHEVVLGGKLAAKTSFSLSRPSSPRVEDLK